MSDRRARDAALVAVVPESFHPQRVWDIPQTITSGELFAKNLPMHDVAGFVRTFNKRQLETSLADRRWAIAIRHTQTRRGRHDYVQPPPAGDAILTAGSEDCGGPRL